LGKVIQGYIENLSSMKYLRYEPFVIETSLAMPNAVEKLRQNVEPERYPPCRLLTFWIKRRLFEGTVNEADFRIKPIILLRLTGVYTPVLMGHFEPCEKGTKLAISIKPYPSPLIQTLIVIGIIIAVGVGGVLTDGKVGLLFCLPFLVGVVLFYFGSHSAFMDEACYYRTVLEEIFAEK